MKNNMNNILYTLNNEQKTTVRYIEKTIYKLNNCNNSIDFITHCVNNGLISEYTIYIFFRDKCRRPSNKHAIYILQLVQVGIFEDLRLTFKFF